MISNNCIGQKTEADLYHLGIYDDLNSIKSKYGKTKAVIMGGKASRMKSLAEEYQKITRASNKLEDLAASGDRFSMYQVENVLFLSHGMGNASISIALHEISKLLHYAEAKNAVFIRFGTCGGLGLKPGSIVVTDKCYGADLSNDYEIFVCGKSVKRPIILDAKLCNDFLEYAQTHKQESQNIVKGGTFCTNDFYEEQSRLDGAINNLELQQKMQFLNKLSSEYKVCNIEMESSYFGMFCGYLKIRGMVVCMTLLNRLEDDMIKMSKEEMIDHQEKFSRLLLTFVQQL